MEATRNYAISSNVLSLPEISWTHSRYEFNPQDDIWAIPDLSHRRCLNFSALRPLCCEEILLSLKKVLIWYLRERSTAHAANLFNRFKSFVRVIGREDKLISVITDNDILNYNGSLNSKNYWYLGTLSGLLTKWYEMGYPGISSKAFALLEDMSTKGNKKGWDVLTMDPIKGPFDEIELNAIQKAVNAAYARGVIGNRHFSLFWLFQAIGARAIQLAALKVKDFTLGQDEHDKSNYYINVPRAKQRANIRKSFKTRPLNREIGEVVEAWVAQLKVEHASEVADDIPSGELPLFPIWNRENAPGFEHHSNAERLSSELQNLFDLLDVKSHRTNKRIHITTRRFRHTLGTRAGQHHYGELVIAEMLDHNDTQNVQCYVKCVPAIIDNLDKALAKELAPLAAAFTGKIIEKDSAGAQSNQSDVIRFPKLSPATGGVGRCGGCGDCGAAVPVACYVCHNFQAWADAPHEEVLNDLIEQRKKLLEETGDKQIAYANDHVILAVSQVVQMCDDLRENARG